MPPTVVSALTSDLSTPILLPEMVLLCTEKQGDLNHWTSREVPGMPLFLIKLAKPVPKHSWDLATGLVRAEASPTMYQSSHSLLNVTELDDQHGDLV